MKAIPAGTRVRVSGKANQWPFERVSDDGTIIGYDEKRGYLVELKNGRENLYFRRLNLTLKD